MNASPFQGRYTCINIDIDHDGTCTIPRVALVTGSEKSPPGGDTAPTILTEPSRSGLPKHFTLKCNMFRISTVIT